MIRAIAAVALAILTADSLPAALTSQQRLLNLQSFEYVWKTIRDKHWQTKPGGLDWQAIHDEFKPKIEAADSMAAVRAVMNQMLGRLHETHFGIVPADLYSNVDATGGGDGAAGIDVRVPGEQVLVTSVEAGSSAAAQGVRPGWEILKIGGTDIAPVVSKLSEMYAGSTLRDILLRRAILARLDGGDPVVVEFLDGAGQESVKTLAPAQPRGTLVRFGYLNPMHVWFSTSRVGGGAIGYAAFNAFLDPQRLMPAFGDAVEGCHSCAGFILDLRGNPGGIGLMAMGMAGWFISQPDQKLGTLYLRETTLKFVVNPRLKTFAGPLAILVDGTSASTSEILAEGLKDLGRARIFGSHTAGAALPSVFEKLPDGDGFQYAIANYVSAGGQPLEGRGVTPDEETPVTREALLAGKDPALDAAVAWIKQQKTAAK
ncbi:MAG TPA: S41 family peptidase [Bryobacteraceae bacterium]|nr:S41 family peptidase [Bryobacteraceae bacterium]